MNTGPPLRWRIAVIASDAALPAVLATLEADAETVSWFEAGAGLWRVEALAAAAPDRAALDAALTRAAITAGLPPPPLVIAPLEARDWLAENRRTFPPIAAGRFFVHDANFIGAAPPGSVALRLEAGHAFGSGHHETTRGCLLALDGLARGRVFRRAVDLGCGSGILALAMARCWHVPVLAADVDPIALDVTRENARRNGVAAQVRTVLSDGWRAAPLRPPARFDLVTANILAAPLRAMAPALARGLAPGGVAVLSGLLAWQEAMVLTACRTVGLRLLHRVRLGDWPTLILARRGA